MKLFNFILDSYTQDFLISPPYFEIFEAIRAFGIVAIFMLLFLLSLHFIFFEMPGWVMARAMILLIIIAFLPVLIYLAYNG